MKPNSIEYTIFKKNITEVLTDNYGMTVKELTEEVDMYGDVKEVNVTALVNTPVQKITVNLNLNN